MAVGLQVMLARRANIHNIRATSVRVRLWLRPRKGRCGLATRGGKVRPRKGRYFRRAEKDVNKPFAAQQRGETAHGSDRAAPRYQPGSIHMALLTMHVQVRVHAVRGVFLCLG